jgi:hypothetical protein
MAEWLEPFRQFLNELLILWPFRRCAVHPERDVATSCANIGSEQLCSGTLTH